MRSTELDDWLPDPAVRTHHRRAAAAPPETVWESAREVRLADTPRLGRLVRWRIPGLAPAMTYHELFRGYPFTVLEESDRLLVSGMVGKIWTIARDYPRLDGPEAFAAWSLARVIGSLPITPGGLGLVEVGLTSVLVGFGGNKAGVVAAVLLFRFLTIVPTLLLGAGAGFVWRRYRRPKPAELS